MPYHVAGDGPFKVVEDATGKVVGTHPSRKKANRQVAALYANVVDAKKSYAVIRAWSGFHVVDEVGKIVGKHPTKKIADRHATKLTTRVASLAKRFRHVHVVNFAKTKSKTDAAVSEFAVSIKAVIQTANEDLSNALAGQDLGDFLRSDVGGSDLWKNLYQKPLEEAWRSYTSVVMGEAGAAQFRAIFGTDDAFNVDNPYATMFLDSNGGEMIRGIEDETRNGVRKAIRDLISNGGGNLSATVDDVADMVGLSERDVGAVLSRQTLLAAQGWTDDEIEQERQKQVDRLLDARASTIARTESIRAESQGVLASWKDAVDQEMLPRSAMKSWLADDVKACDDCVALQEADPVGVDEDFDSDAYGNVDGPPLHPNCACSVVLVWDDDVEAAVSGDDSEGD